MLRKFVLVSIVLFAAACGTTFDGEAHFPGGPSVCNERCTKMNMEMASFIYAGEFASACVCQPRRNRRDQATSEAEVSALVGVMTEMRMRRAVVGGVLGGGVGGVIAGSQ